MTPVVIERVTVGDRTIEAVVRATAPRFATTQSTPGIAEKAVDLLPGLARHTCENGAGSRFVDELRDTETAHLIEHIACEIMSLAGSPRTLRGETQWNFQSDGPYVYRVRLEYDDDLVAMGALKLAIECAAWLLADEPKPDVTSGAASLQSLRADRPV